MSTTSSFQERLASTKPVVIAEISPPQSADPAAVRAVAKRFAGKVHALGVCDNRDMVRMAALAAATLVAGEGVEPILHVTTRDRNRIALISEALGAQALGIRNVLCTGGSHQTLGRFRAARNVYDVDSVQLVQAYSQLAANGSLVNEGGIPGAGPFCLGAVASPDADPMAMQVTGSAKKVKAGAAFLVTRPIYDLERFHAWWKAVTARGLHEKACILLGIQALTEEELAKAREGGPAAARIPQATLQRVGSPGTAAARRAAAIEVAVETVKHLSSVAGVRGFGVCGDGDCDGALEILDRAQLRSA